MTVAPGARIGTYEIVSALGAGGMGEVYRARDGKLNRDVAIKILPELFALDPDRLARFEREAQTLAALNHQNIAAIYGVVENPPALVMELVEGDDLSAHVARGAMPMSEVLPIARQIAEALEAAHEMGIVHRDLKPANIKVRPDGTVKVLDFGLAKALTPESTPGSASQMNSPTMASPAMTQVGFIIGTAAYMAPEQAKGRAVDKRADIWAFGCVLYEMITGRRAFEGDDVSTTLAAVLMRDPDWSAMPAGTPAAMQVLLRRCLERDARRRLRDIGEARIAFDAPGDAGAPAPVQTGRGVTGWMLKVVTGAAVTAAGVMAVLLVARPSGPPPVVRASIQLPAGSELAWGPSNPTNISISRDGSVIAFTAVPLGHPPNEAILHIRRLDAADSTPIADSAGVNVSFFSPDGRWVGFFANGALKKVSVSGGAPVVIAALANKNIWGGTWLSDGTIIYANPQTTGEMLYAVPDSGGEPRLLSRVDRLDLDNSFPYAYGADQLLVTRWTGGLYANGHVAAYSRADSRVTHVVVDGGSHGHVLSSGDLVYARGAELLGASFDTKIAALRGTPVSLLTGVLTDLRYGTPMFDISPSGTLVYAPQAAAPAVPALQWLDRAGKTVTLLEDRHLDVEQTRLSADGVHIVYQSVANSRDIDLWTYDTAAGSRSRLTDVPGEEYSPVILPDGQVMFAAWRGVWGMYRLPLIGGREDMLQFEEGVPNLQAWSISPDGRWLAVSGDSAAATDIGVVDLRATVGTLTWLLTSRFTERRATFSPSGSHLAFESDQLGKTDIWVARFADGRILPPVPVSRDGGLDAFWSRDGRTLYYTAGTKLMAADLPATDAARFGAPHQVLDLPHTRAFGVGADGRFIAIRRERAPVTRLDLILNWTGEIRQRVQ